MITPSNPNLRIYISGNEGERLKEYPDSKNIPTIGIGYNMSEAIARVDFAHVGANYDEVLSGRVALTESQAQSLFTISLARAISGMYTIFGDYADTLPTGAQFVIVDMLFTMGFPRFLGFKDFIKCMRIKNYAGAASEIENSVWAEKEALNRAARDAAMIRACSTATPTPGG